MEIDIDKELQQMVVKSCAILGVAGVSCYAISQGHDGIVVLTTIGIISGIGGRDVLDKILKRP